MGAGASADVEPPTACNIGIAAAEYFCDSQPSSDLLERQTDKQSVPSEALPVSMTLVAASSSSSSANREGLLRRS
jgi:hypothetical protein